MTTARLLTCLFLAASGLHAQTVSTTGDVNPSPAVSPTWVIPGLTIGVTGAGTLTLTGGGAVNVAGAVTLASQAGSTGTLNFGSADLSHPTTGGTFVSAGIVFGSGSGAINFNQTDQVTLVQNITGNGRLVQDGSGVTILVGVTALTGADSFDGVTTIKQGTLQVGGGGKLLQTGAAVFVGEESGDSGQLVIQNGALVSDARGYIGLRDGSHGEAVVSGTNSLWTSGTSLAVGYEGEGSLRIEAGAKVIAGAESYIGYAPTGSGEALVTGAGSEWRHDGSDNFHIGNAGAGTLTVADGGSLNAAASFIYIATQAGSTGTLNIGSYDLAHPTTGGSVAAFDIFFGDGTGVLNFNQTDTVPLTDVAAISGSGGVVQRCSGTTILPNYNDYTGPTTVSAGKLIVDGALYSSETTVKNGGTLGGAGDVADVALESGATLAPGDDQAIGRLGAVSLLWNPGAALAFDLGTGTSDLLDLSGGLFKGGMGDFAFTFADAGWQVGETYTLISFAGTTDFTAADFTFTNDGGFDGTFGVTGHSVQFTLAAVPEPSVWGLVLAGLVAAGFARLKPRSARHAVRLSAFLLAASTLHAQSVIGTRDLNPSPAVSPTWSVAGDLFVGDGGIGSLEITEGGEVDVAGITSIGKQAGSTGTVTVDGGTFFAASQLNVGFSGTGTLNIYDGEVIVGTLGGGETDLLAGTNNIGVGTINISGGTLKVVNGYLSLGFINGNTPPYDPDAHGYMNISGGTVDISGELRVGDKGIGVLNITGGNIHSSLANIGRQGWLDNGTVTMSAGTWTNDSLFIVGNGGYGSFTLTGGVVTDVDGVIGRLFTTRGYVEVSGGTWTNTGSLYIGGPDYETYGFLRLIGPGVINVGSGTVYIAPDATGEGELNFGSENLAAPTTSGTLNATHLAFGVGQGPLPNERRINFNQIDTLTLAADISGDGDVVQRGSGTTILTGTNTYTRGTTVERGTLLVDGSITGATTVKNGGTFGGSGSAGGITLESGATLAPTGSLDATSLTWNAGAVLAFDLGAGTSDVLTLTGSLTKSGDGVFAFTFADSGWQVGETYTLVTFAGTDFSASDFSFTNGGDFDGVFAVTGNSLQFTLNAVPEPSPLMLMGVSLLVLIFLLRRRRQDAGA